ncbi:galactose oxidase [Aureococcus anophagefferens]|nr:galactose oxidase [Aureococcus anophagefferens]
MVPASGLAAAADDARLQSQTMKVLLGGIGAAADDARLQRWGHSAVRVGARVAVFGGYGGAKPKRCGDVLLVDASGAVEEAAIAADAAAPAAREQHAAAGWRTGRRRRRADPAKPFRDAWTCAVAGDACAWTAVDAAGDAPPARWAHALLPPGGDARDRRRDAAARSRATRGRSRSTARARDRRRRASREGGENRPLARMRAWLRVTHDEGPCQRSLHVAAIWRDKMLCFGGYDGSNRVNDCWEFDFGKRSWSLVVPASGSPPTPRDRHVAVVWGSSFYVFAGFDGTSRVNDFHEFSFGSSSWAPVRALSGLAPSPRHSHAAVVYHDSLYVFGGYDGSYRCDFHEFNFVTCAWSPITSDGRVPRARYRATTVVHEHAMYLFGGHDGTRHLNDVHVFDFGARAWSGLQAEGPAPIPRDSHVAVTHGHSMFVFGGSTGSAMNDFHELRLDGRKWQPVQASGYAPGHRFCHVAVFKFGFGGTDIPASSLITDLRQLVDSETLSDVTFLVDGLPPRASEIAINDVRHPIFLALLEYLYTDNVDIALDIAMELFQAADQFGVERLKRMCDTRPKSLREKCLNFILTNFDAVTRTASFEEMGRVNVELVFEILKSRSN